MDKVTTPVAFSFQFNPRKLLKTLYLFTSHDPVNLNASVIMTEKTRHFSARPSQDRNHHHSRLSVTTPIIDFGNLTVILCEAYKQR